MRENPRNARFWVWECGGWVKLTLKPGQELSWSRSWDHEEGWSSEGFTLTHEGDLVRCQAGSDGRDCDGRLSRHAEYECHLANLRDVDTEDNVHNGHHLERVETPDWFEVSKGQRDHTAEAMGY